MCLGVPVRVVGPGENDDLIRIQTDDGVRSVNRMMIEGPLEPGSWLVLHLGFAMERISETDALEALALLRVLGGQDEPPSPDVCLDQAPAPATPSDGSVSPGS